MSDLQDSESREFGRKLLLSALLPAIFVALLWLTRFVETGFDIPLFRLGIYPLSLQGLPGILLSPFIHEDAGHLFNNTIPLLVLGTALFYFYPGIAPRLVAISWLVSGIMVWIIGRESWHIGASGLVYSIAAFLFVSGLLRRYFRLLALSMLVVYLYGSMVWGMFPFVDVHVSWEAHMSGAIAGVVLAFWYRGEGPGNPEPDWFDDDDDDNIEAGNTDQIGERIIGGRDHEE